MTRNLLESENFFGSYNGPSLILNKVGRDGGKGGRREGREVGREGGREGELEGKV